MKAFRITLRSGQEHVVPARSYYQVRAGDSLAFVFVGEGDDGWRSLRRFNGAEVAAITPVRPNAAGLSPRLTA
jgi:hypothetical protein